MKIIIVLSGIIVLVIAVLAFFAFSDASGEGECTAVLEECLTGCDKDKFFEGSACVVKCSFSNVSCLVESSVKE